MSKVLRWRKRNGLTQVDAAPLLGISQAYLALLERGARPVTRDLQIRMEAFAKTGQLRKSDDVIRAQLSALGYPAFAHVAKSRPRPRPDTLLMTILALPDADARLVDALPWLAATFESQFDFATMVRQAKLENLQNRLGLILQMARIHTPAGVSAIRELDRARLMQEQTLCWDSLPAATRAWMRENRTPLAEHWNVLTRLGSEYAESRGQREVMGKSRTGDDLRPEFVACPRVSTPLSGHPELS